MKRATALIAAGMLSSCIQGDPRNTALENRAAHPIVAIYTDDGFHMSDNIQIQPGAAGALFPNYHFQDLGSLKIRENGRLFAMSPETAAKLAAICSDFCTLTYRGAGVISIRRWEGLNRS